jgi:signal transduction histidine kinase/CheY-like chemotaxis protein
LGMLNSPKPDTSSNRYPEPTNINHNEYIMALAGMCSHAKGSQATFSTENEFKGLREQTCQHDGYGKNDDGNNANSTGRRVYMCCMGFSRWNASQQNKHQLRFLRKHHLALLITVLIFAILCGASISIYLVFANDHQRNDREDALDLATNTGSWFAYELERALTVPIFSLAQFATELEIFRELPDRIGPAGEPGSLPFLSLDDNDDDDVQQQKHTHRNVTGVCDDPVLVARFNDIASTIKHNARSEGVLVNLQLSPEAVICLLYPLNNTEDFSNGVFMDNTGARGLDLFADPGMKYMAEATMKQDKAVVAGPLSLRQCSKECDATVEKAFIARLPIEVPDHQITIDGVPYNRWGFATALVNWEALVHKSGVYETFAELGMQFQLTRTDQIYNETTDSYYENIVILAETSGYQSDNRVKVTTALQTTDNEWEITVTYGGNYLAIRSGIIVVCVVVSALISFLVFTVMVQRQIHTEQAAVVEIEHNMTAYFAHELRNPLGAIDCALRSMPEKQLPDSAKELIDGMMLCSTFMATVMNGLLDLRKLEEGKMVLHSEPMSLSCTVQAVHKMLLPSVKPGVVFRAICETQDRDWVLGDSNRIQQALTNIVTNAIKYTLSGSITLSCTWQEDQGDFRDPTRLHAVRFECSDTGPGIPKNEQGKIFEKFVQRGGAPGTGLGLSISKHIVQMMGGDIRIESDPTIQPGTKFIIAIPMLSCDEAVTNVVDVHEDSHPIEEPYSILIVDDLELNRKMLRRRFELVIAPNCIVTEAASGEEALTICETELFDVIVVDQYMEEGGGLMVGVDVVIAMRRMRINSTIIGCSGNDLEVDFKEAGADLAWQKPIPANETIIRQLRSMLTGSRGAVLSTGNTK